MTVGWEPYQVTKGMWRLRGLHVRYDHSTQCPECEGEGCTMCDDIGRIPVNYPTKKEAIKARRAMEKDLTDNGPAGPEEIHRARHITRSAYPPKPGTRRY